MVGPRFKQPRQEDISGDPWQTAADALQKAAGEASIKAALRTLDNASLDLSVQEKTNETAVLASNFIDSIRMRIVHSGMKYDELGDYLKKKLKYAEGMTGKTSSETAFKTVTDEEIRSFVASYASFVLLRVDPNYLYDATKSETNQFPIGAQYLYDDLSDLLSNDYERASIAKRMKTEIERQFANSSYKEILEGALTGNPADMLARLKEITKTQKAIDGLDIAIKHRLFEDRGAMTDGEVTLYFNDFNLSRDEKNLLKGQRSPATLEGIINKVLDSIESSKFSILAIEANYGEKAGVLDELLKWMGAPQHEESAAEKLREFYLAAASNPYAIKKSWSLMQSSYHNTASHLLSDQQKAPPQASDSDASYRDSYDIAAMLSFMYAASKSSFLNGHATDSQAYSLLTTASGLNGTTTLPTPVTCTIFQNYKTLDSIRTSIGPDNFDGLLGITASLTNYIARIYQSPLGAEFNMSDSRDVVIKTMDRKEAAYYMMTEAEKLKDKNDLLTDLVARTLQNPWPAPSEQEKIKFIPPEQQVLVVPEQQDILRINELFREYTAANKTNIEDQETVVDNLLGDYQKFKDFYNQSPESFRPVGLDAAWQFYAKLRSTEYAWDAGMSDIFSKLTAQGKSLTWQSIYGTGGVSNILLTNPEDQANITATTQQGGQANVNIYQTQVNNLFQTSARNLQLGNYGIYDMFASWQQTKNSLDMQAVTESDVLASMHGFMPAGDFALYYVRNSQDDRLTLENIDAYVKVKGQWFRYSNLNQYLDDFNGYIKDHYAATGLDLGSVKMYGAFEQQDPQKKVAGVVGIGNAGADPRFALLGGQDIRNDKLATGSIKIGPTLVTGAYMFFQEGDTGWNTKSDFLGSVLSKHFYAQAMGGTAWGSREFAGGKYVNDSGLGVSAIVEWGPGGADFIVNGQYVRKNWGLEVYGEQQRQNHSIVGGKLIIKNIMNTGLTLTVEGLQGINELALTDKQRTDLANALQYAASELGVVEDKASWDLLSEDEQRKVLTAIKASVDRAIFESEFLTPFLVNDPSSQLSVTLGNEKWATKFSYARFDYTDPDAPIGSPKVENAYLLNMTTIREGKVTLSSVLGAPIDKPGPYLIGGSIKAGDFKFGEVLYFDKNSHPIYESTLVYENEKDWLAGFIGKLTDTGDYEKVFVAHDRDFAIGLENLKDKDLSSQKLEVMKAFGLFSLGLAGNIVKLQDYENKNLSLQLKYDASRRSQLYLQGTVYTIDKNGVTTGVKRPFYDIKFGFTYNF